MARTRSKRAQKHEYDSPLPSDLEDDVDKFYKTRDKLHLNVHEDSLSEDELSIDEEEAVLDVSDPSDDDDEFDTDEEIEKDTHLGRRKNSSEFHMNVTYFSLPKCIPKTTHFYPCSKTPSKSPRSKTPHRSRGTR